MNLARIQLESGDKHWAVVADDHFRLLNRETERAKALNDLLCSDDPTSECEQLAIAADTAVSFGQAELLAPIDSQEVWAAGVTYRRSKTARMEESEAAATCYDRVYESPRPELFFKGNAARTVGPGGALRIRADATWNVPEPELTLALNARLEIRGFTIGNDMSSRDIEGDNPLYLPQAKVYDQCCGLGPWITLSSAISEPQLLDVNLVIRRNDDVVFEGQTNTSQMARRLEELVHWLGRDQNFADGVFLMTGTGIVPDSNFTLAAGDETIISIEGIGTLHHQVTQSSEKFTDPERQPLD